MAVKTMLTGVRTSSTSKRRPTRPCRARSTRSVVDHRRNQVSARATPRLAAPRPPPSTAKCRVGYNPCNRSTRPCRPNLLPRAKFWLPGNARSNSCACGWTRPSVKSRLCGTSWARRRTESPHYSKWVSLVLTSGARMGVAIRSNRATRLRWLLTRYALPRFALFSCSRAR